MDENINYTPFSDIYDCFLAKITDDMYMELTEDETYQLLEQLLINAIPSFEFPRKRLLDNYETKYIERIDVYNGVESNYLDATIYVYNEGKFFEELNTEEIDILATYMIVEWIGQQLASVNVTRMQYSGDDFKFTSQANHMSKLITLKEKYTQEGFHKQRLYKRRNSDGKSTFADIMASSVREDGWI